MMSRIPDRSSMATAFSFAIVDQVDGVVVIAVRRDALGTLCNVLRDAKGQFSLGFISLAERLTEVGNYLHGQAEGLNGAMAEVEGVGQVEEVKLDEGWVSFSLLQECFDELVALVSNCPSTRKYARAMWKMGELGETVSQFLSWDVTIEDLGSICEVVVDKDGEEHEIREAS